MLADDAVTDAAFKGSVTFEDEGLNARAADIRYQPRMNRSRSTGRCRRRSACLGRSDFHRCARDRCRARGSPDRRHGGEDDAEPAEGAKPLGKRRGCGIAIPGLLSQDEVAHINANALDYRGQAGQAVYRGNATLWQGKTTIRGDTISLDQEKGSLIATGRRNPRWNSIRACRSAPATRSATTTRSAS